MELKTTDEEEAPMGGWGAAAVEGERAQEAAGARIRITMSLSIISFHTV